MPRLDFVYIVLLGFCCPIWSQNIILGPSNTAARVGDTANLTCRPDQSGRDQIIEWSLTGNGTTTPERIYYYDPARDNEFVLDPSLFFVDPADRDQGRFDLTVQDVSASTAGLYQCSLLTTNPVVRAEARVVSVSPIRCSPEPAELVVIVGVEVTLVCEASYTGYKPPSFTWSTEYADFPGEWVWNYEKSTLSSNVTATPEVHDVMFTCNLGFQRDVGDAADAPTYNDTCSTYFRVEHGATSVTITPEPNPGGVVTVSVGSYLNCTASGFPEVRIDWEDITGGGLVYYEEDELLMIDDWSGMTKTFSCLASNTFGGVQREARLNITVEVVNDDPAPPVKEGTGVETWVIIVAVVVPVVVIGGTAGGIVGFLRYRKKKDKKTQAAQGPRGYGQFSDAAISSHPGGGGNRGPPQAQPRPGHNPRPAPRGMANGKAPTNLSGAPVIIPEGTENPQQNQSGKDSPGYGDLGVRHFGGSRDVLDGSRISLDPDPKFYHGGGSNLSLNPANKGQQVQQRAYSRDQQQQQQHQQQQRMSRASRGSQGSILQGQPPPRQHQPQPQQQPQYHPQQPQRQQQEPYSRQQAEVYYHNVPGHAQGSTMGSQASLNQPIPRAASQASLNTQPYPPSHHGGSQTNILASRGHLGSRGSLASQGSRGYGVMPLQVPYEVPDTTV